MRLHEIKEAEKRVNDAIALQQEFDDREEKCNASAKAVRDIMETMKTPITSDEQKNWEELLEMTKYDNFSKASSDERPSGTNLKNALFLMKANGDGNTKVEFTK